jgi:hypothetical protein
MKNVDPLIRYLSGDLAPEEARAIEDELRENESLRETLEEVRAAYRLIGEQLRLRDEEEFRSRVIEAMEQTDRGSRFHPVRRRTLGMLFLSLAAGLALVWVLLRVTGDRKDPFLALYHPERDPVVLAMCDETRGDPSSVPALYSAKAFRSAYNQSALQLAGDPGNQEAQLFNLLSALELDLEEQALHSVDRQDDGQLRSLGQALSWYRILALVKTGQTEQAEKELEALLENPGPYSRDAHKLHSLLTK